MVVGRVTLDVQGGGVLGVYQHATVTDATAVLQREYQARFINVEAPADRSRLEIYRAFYYDAVIAFQKEPRKLNFSERLHFHLYVLRSCVFDLH